MIALASQSLAMKAIFWTEALNPLFEGGYTGTGITPNLAHAKNEHIILSPAGNANRSNNVIETKKSKKEPVGFVPKAIHGHDEEQTVDKFIDVLDWKRFAVCMQKQLLQKQFVY